MSSLPWSAVATVRAAEVWAAVFSDMAVSFLESGGRCWLEVLIGLRFLSSWALIATRKGPPVFREPLRRKRYGA